jgi:hypothetical protein
MLPIAGIAAMINILQILNEQGRVSVTDKIVIYL